MTDHLAILRGAVGKDKEDKVTYSKEDNTGIKDLISKAFCTRDLAHFAHWETNSYAKHQALGGLYDEIISKIDEIVEVYQGKFGIIEGLNTEKKAIPADILSHIEAEAAWIGANRESISNKCEAVAALLDELDAGYLKVIYKLKNLK